MFVALGNVATAFLAIATTYFVHHCENNKIIIIISAAVLRRIFVRRLSRVRVIVITFIAGRTGSFVVVLVGMNSMMMRKRKTPTRRIYSTRASTREQK